MRTKSIEATGKLNISPDQVCVDLAVEMPKIECLPAGDIQFYVITQMHVKCNCQIK